MKLYANLRWWYGRNSSTPEDLNKAQNKETYLCCERSELDVCWVVYEARVWVLPVPAELVCLYSWSRNEALINGNAEAQLEGLTTLMEPQTLHLCRLEDQMCLHQQSYPQSPRSQAIQRLCHKSEIYNLMGELDGGWAWLTAISEGELTWVV